MKKLSPHDREFARQRQAKNLKRIKRRKYVANRNNRRRNEYREAFGARRDFRPYRGRRELVAPENFSFIENTAKMVEFLGDMEKAFKGHFDVFIDFSGIKRLTPDS